MATSGFWRGIVYRIRHDKGTSLRLARAVEMACTEAFMTGRVYAAGGEKESPAVIHEKMMARSRAAFMRGYRGDT